MALLGNNELIATTAFVAWQWISRYISFDFIVKDTAPRGFVDTFWLFLSTGWIVDVKKNSQKGISLTTSRPPTWTGDVDM